MESRAIAIIRIVVAAAVNAANVAGYALDADLAMSVAMSAVAAVTLVWVWWKNNDVTEAAAVASAYMRQLKMGDREPDAEEV